MNSFFNKRNVKFLNKNINEKIWLDFCNNIDVQMQNSNIILKNDATSSVCVVKIDNIEYIVKRSNIKNLLHAFKNSLRETRAMRSVKNSTKLHAIGVNTFTPYAVIENKFGPFNGQSYLICSYVKGMQALDFFADEQCSSYWEIAAKSITQMIYVLGKHGICHRDLNLSNIIIINNEAWLVDLDGMRQYTSNILKNWFVKREYSRFMENWSDMPHISKKVEQIFIKQLS